MSRSEGAKAMWERRRQQYGPTGYPKTRKSPRKRVPMFRIVNAKGQPTTLDDALQEMIKSGKRPRVLLSPAIEIRIPKRRGRVPLTDQRLPKHRRFAARYVGRRGVSKPHCLARGCDNYLKIHQVGFCSDDCANITYNRAQDLLRWVEKHDAAKDEPRFKGRPYPVPKPVVLTE